MGVTVGVSEMMSPTGVATPRVLTSYEFSADNVTGLGIPHPSVHILSDSVRCDSVVIYRPDVFCPDSPTLVGNLGSKMSNFNYSMFIVQARV